MTACRPAQPVQTLTVTVTANPLIPGSGTDVTRCLAALDVVKLMDWWPGTPHAPHRNPDKVRAMGVLWSDGAGTFAISLHSKFQFRLTTKLSRAS